MAGLAFTRGGKTLLVGLRAAAASGEIQEWDAEAGTLRRPWKRLDTPLDSLAVSADGGRVAVGCDDGTVTLYDADTGEERQILRDGGRIFSLSFSPDGNRLASCVGPDLPGIAGSIDAVMSVKLWDFQARTVGYFMTGQRSAITAVAFSPDGERIASGNEATYIEVLRAKGNDATVRIWNSATVFAATRMLPSLPLASHR
jgi:WD40 repeat protein